MCKVVSHAALLYKADVSNTVKCFYIKATQLVIVGGQIKKKKKVSFINLLFCVCVHVCISTVLRMKLSWSRSRRGNETTMLYEVSSFRRWRWWVAVNFSWDGNFVGSSWLQEILWGKYWSLYLEMASGQLCRQDYGNKNHLMICLSLSLHLFCSKEHESVA